MLESISENVSILHYFLIEYKNVHDILYYGQQFERKSRTFEVNFMNFHEFQSFFVFGLDKFVQNLTIHL